jgi:phenylalanyl-tRNA synthetase beta chain
LVEDVRLFDEYLGEQVPTGQRSLAFRVIYRDPEATLTDKRVEKVHQRLAQTARDRFGATLR